MATNRARRSSNQRGHWPFRLVHPEGSIGYNSCILASRFGGTPWAWRQESQPSEEDYYTCIQLLTQEYEELEELKHG